MAAAQAQHEEVEEMEDDGGPILNNKLEQKYNLYLFFLYICSLRGALDIHVVFYSSCFIVIKNHYISYRGRRILDHTN